MALTYGSYRSTGPVSASGHRSFHVRLSHVANGADGGSAAVAHQDYIERDGAVATLSGDVVRAHGRPDADTVGDRALDALRAGVNAVLTRLGRRPKYAARPGPKPPAPRSGEGDRMSFGSLGGDYADRVDAWRRIAASERSNGRVQSRAIIALPHELSPRQLLALARDICRRLFEDADAARDDRRKTLYWATVHRPTAENDPRNWHLHVAWYDRPVREIGDRDSAVRYDCELVTARGRKDRRQSSRAWPATVREIVADATNHALDAAALDCPRRSPQTYADLGIDKTPQLPLGPAGAALLRRGILTPAARHNRRTEEAWAQTRTAAAADRQAHDQSPARARLDGLRDVLAAAMAPAAAARLSGGRAKALLDDAIALARRAADLAEDRDAVAAREAARRRRIDMATAARIAGIETELAALVARAARTARTDPGSALADLRTMLDAGVEVVRRDDEDYRVRAPDAPLPAASPAVVDAGLADRWDALLDELRSADERRRRLAVAWTRSHDRETADPAALLREGDRLAAAAYVAAHEDVARRTIDELLRKPEWFDGRRFLVHPRAGMPASVPLAACSADDRGWTPSDRTIDDDLSMSVGSGGALAYMAAHHPDEERAVLAPLEEAIRRRRAEIDEAERRVREAAARTRAEELARRAAAADREADRIYAALASATAPAAPRTPGAPERIEIPADLRAASLPPRPYAPPPPPPTTAPLAAPSAASTAASTAAPTTPPVVPPVVPSMPAPGPAVPPPSAPAAPVAAPSPDDRSLALAREVLAHATRRRRRPVKQTSSGWILGRADAEERAALAAVAERDPAFLRTLADEQVAIVAKLLQARLDAREPVMPIVAAPYAGVKGQDLPLSLAMLISAHCTDPRIADLVAACHAAYDDAADSVRFGTVMDDLAPLADLAAQRAPVLTVTTSHTVSGLR